MKTFATIALVAAGTVGFAGVSLAEGCNWGKASYVTAEADTNATPIPAKTEMVAEAEAPAEATHQTVVAQADVEKTVVAE